MRRKPTLQERRVIAISAVRYIAHHVAQGDPGTPYEIAFRGLGQLTWLHPQSRDGIAALAAACHADGTVPYEGLTSSEMDLLEMQRLNRGGDAV